MTRTRTKPPWLWYLAITLVLTIGVFLIDSTANRRNDEVKVECPNGIVLHVPVGHEVHC